MEIYKDEKIMIDKAEMAFYYQIFIEKNKNTSIRYLLHMDDLKEIATTKRGGIEKKIAEIDENILRTVEELGIGIDGLHVALCQTYIKDIGYYPK